MVPTHTTLLPEKTPLERRNSTDRRKGTADPSETAAGGMQGEGNYDAARNFNEAQHQFVASGKVEAAARAAAPGSDAEQREMIAAEEEGKRPANGESRETGKP